MRFADDVSELRVGSIFRSSETTVIIVNDFILGLYRNCGDQGGWDSVNDVANENIVYRGWG